MKRISSVDGLRAYGVLTVVLNHAIENLNTVHVVGDVLYKPFYEQETYYDLLIKFFLIVFNGRAVISLFFILSGFVLLNSILSLSKHKQKLIFINFTIKRIIRIYLPLIPCLLAIYIGFYLLHQFNPVLFQAFSIKEFIENCLLYDTQLIGPTWTLRIEAEAIAFIVLAFYAYQRWGFQSLLLLFIVSLILFDNAAFFLQGNYQIVLLNTCLINFFIGFLCAIIPVELFIKEIQAIGWKIPLFIMIFLRGFLAESSRVGIIIESLLAAYLILFLRTDIKNSFTAFLNAPIMQYLGKISFSFYIWNVFFLLIFHKINRFLIVSQHPLEFGLLMTLVIYFFTLPVAHYSEKYIEIPGLKWGKQLANTVTDFLYNIKKAVVSKKLTMLEQAENVIDLSSENR